MAEETQTEAPAVVETMVVKVDGREVEVPKLTEDWQGNLVPTTVLQACKHAGNEIPHYCYHPKLPVAGNCRMCLVHVGMPGRPGPDGKPPTNEDGSLKIDPMVLPYERQTPKGVIGCATNLVPGMEIYASSPETKQMREAVLESQLINHPLDCPICDQAGECKLQEYSSEHGQSESSFAEYKVHKPKKVNLGPRIILDAERCVLCTRCIRFSRDIADDDALGIVNRGSYNTISTFLDTPFDNNYTLNTVDLCPVGALTSKDFRFQMRVWFLKETKSLCTGCGTGCNTLIGSRENIMYRYEPRENNAVNGPWMCDAGRLNYKWIGREDRLSEVTGASGWATAITEISAKLEEAQSGSVAIIGGARQTNEELYLLKKLANKLEAITDSAPRSGQGDNLLCCPDKNPNSAGSRLIGIANEDLGSRFAEIAQGIEAGTITSLIVFGDDVTKHGIDETLLDKLDLLVVSDILPNATTSKAHYLLPGCAHTEKRGTFTSVKGQVQKFMKALDGPGNARPEWEFLHELAENTTGQNGFSTIEGLFNQMAGEVEAFKDKELTWASLGNEGVTVEI
jgi:NADH-quinone oxidoreductase subunit G